MSTTARIHGPPFPTETHGDQPTAGQWMLARAVAHTASSGHSSFKRDLVLVLLAMLAIVATIGAAA